METTSTIGIAVVIITALVSAFKNPKLGGVVKKIPKRWRLVFPVVLSAVAGILSNVVVGIPWQQALMVGLFSGPTAVFANHDVIHGLFGRKHEEK